MGQEALGFRLAFVNPRPLCLGVLPFPPRTGHPDPLPPPVATIIQTHDRLCSPLLTHGSADALFHHVHLLQLVGRNTALQKRRCVGLREGVWGYMADVV